MINLVSLSLYFNMCESSIFITRQYSPDNKKQRTEKHYGKRSRMASLVFTQFATIKWLHDDFGIKSPQKCTHENCTLVIKKIPYESGY